MKRSEAKTSWKKTRFVSPRRGYSTWKQVAGYFDGDGSPKVHGGTWAVTITVSWSDQDRGILRHIQQFLSQKGISSRLSRFRQGKRTYFELSVGEGGGDALKALKGMQPHLDKKRIQVTAAINYLENRITGNQFVLVLNSEIRKKRRSSYIMRPHLPFRKGDGLYFARASHRFGKGRALTQEQLEAAKHDRTTLGLSYAALARKYGIGESTMYYIFKEYA